MRPPQPDHRRPPMALIALAAGGALMVLFAPTLEWLARSWSVHAYYGHGPLVIVAALVLLWRDRTRLVQAPPSPWGLAVVASGIGIHVLAGMRTMHVVSAGGLLVCLAGLALSLGGRTAIRAAALPLSLMALAVPLPFVERLAPPLAGHVAGAAAWFAATSGVDVTQVGAQLIVGDGAMTVGAPCSGLRSIVALSTLAVLLAGVLDGPRTRRAAIVLAAVPLAILFNGLRLTALLVIAEHFGTASSLAFFHGPSSPLLFIGAAASLVVFSRRIGCDVRVAV